MLGLAIYCQLCRAHIMQGESVPVYCPSCLRPTRWTTSEKPEDASSAEVWTVDDRRFLRGLNIGRE